MDSRDTTTTIKSRMLNELRQKEPLCRMAPYVIICDCGSHVTGKPFRPHVVGSTHNNVVASVVNNILVMLRNIFTSSNGRSTEMDNSVKTLSWCKFILMKHSAAELNNFIIQ